MTVTKKVTYDLTKIYFADVLHLAFVRRDFVGLQTWKSTGLYTLQLTMRDGAEITAEYDTEDKWQSVIRLVEEDLTP